MFLFTCCIFALCLSKQTWAILFYFGSKVYYLFIIFQKHPKTVPKLDSNCTETSFWHHHKTYNNSKISDIFEGLLKSTLTCLTCGKTSNTFEVYSCLSLPILSSRCSLRVIRFHKIYVKILNFIIFSV